MTLFSNVLVYPEGDRIEIEHPLTFNQYVDLNGHPLSLPLQTQKMIVYRIYRISTSEERGEVTTYFFLELVTNEELFGLAEKHPAC